MISYWIIILVIILIFYIGEDSGLSKRSGLTFQSYIYGYIPTKDNNPYNFDIDMSKICDSVGNCSKNDSDKSDDKPGKISREKILENLNDCEKKAIGSCPPEKSLETQLFEQKELIKNLKLELEDKTPKYRFSKSDRYFLDNDPDAGDYRNISSNSINVTDIGDDKITAQMLVMGGRSKESLDNRSLWSKNALIPYLEEELKMHENSYG